MERYAQPDTTLRQNYGIRELTLGAESIDEVLRVDTIDVYTKPLAGWMPTRSPEHRFYEFEYHTLVGLFHVVTNEHSLEKRLIAKLTYPSPIQFARFMSPPTPQVGETVSEWSSLDSRVERDFLHYLVENGRRDVAQELDSLIQQVADSPDDNDPIQQESLDALVRYFVTHEPPFSPFGCIVAAADGVLGAEWRLPPTQPDDSQWRNGDGILSLRFLPSGDIVFAGETRPVGTEVEFYDFGEEPHELVASRISPFFELLRLADAGQ